MALNRIEDVVVDDDDDDNDDDDVMVEKCIELSLFRMNENPTFFFLLL